MNCLSLFARMFAVLFLLLMAGCGQDSGSSGQTVAQSSLARDTNPQVSDADLAAVVDGNTQFALNVMPLLNPLSNENTFFSPYSVSQAFALLAAGARGTTLSGIEGALFFPSQDRLNPAMNRIGLLLAAKTTGVLLPNGLQTPKINVANALWAQEGFSILPSYLDTLAVNYGAGLHLVDFISASEPSRKTINAWVERQTNDRIQNLIPEGGITSNTRCVLTNAIWFKANWASQFPPAATANRTFNNRDGSPSQLPFMSQNVHMPYAQMHGCEAVDIPYAGDNLSMLVLMPAAGTFDAFLSSLTPTVLNDITNHLTFKAMQLSMPKFTFTKSSGLSAILRSLGMSEAFDPTQADFSGIDGRRDLFVTDVFHKAFINVDEAGTEAAAATAIISGATGVPTQDPALSIDHPFIFLIRDRQTGLVLFMGKVVSL